MKNLKEISKIQNDNDKIEALTQFINDEQELLNSMRPPRSRSLPLDSASKMIDKLNNPHPVNQNNVARHLF
ncbi:MULTISPECIES: hypothetical protein [unclassified Legionella]|uniref:hypothetical protein n=1 Tax=unclassified Legionella TaxID=2622702 RepID=UPI00105695DF|nr:MULTISPECIES: hypothetical protein [unclassified Legionella]MDI9818816.1 hypothetical protein [Legionella sp. PL877]